MIPIRDNNPRRTVPFVNVALIIANLAVFAWEGQRKRNAPKVQPEH